MPNVKINQLYITCLFAIFNFLIECFRKLNRNKRLRKRNIVILYLTRSSTLILNLCVETGPLSINGSFLLSKIIIFYFIFEAVI